MIDRRILLASVASLLGLAAFRWLRASPAHAAEKFEIEKTDAEWRARLTPQQYDILRKEGTERRIASLMNKDEDILFLFMTSHGSREHKFSLDLGMLRFNDITPAVLRKLLDDSGIERRVIIISACYSGGFIDALKGDNTLVITAAAADKNSFGCSNENDFTYFGKAYFDEALRKTYSFVEAFEMAKPVIAERERKEGEMPSDPQISLGKDIGPVLDAFAKQREHAAKAEN